MPLQVDYKRMLPLAPDRILAIDPGNVESGWAVVSYTPEVLGHMTLHGFGNSPNSAIRLAMHHTNQAGAMLAIETPRPRGMPTAAEEMETLIEIGRFLQMWPKNWTYVFRGNVKRNLTGVVNSTDAHVRQALIDRFGGEATAIGGKRCKKCSGNGVVGKLRCPVCLLSKRAGNKCKRCKGGTDKSGYVKLPCPACAPSGNPGWASPRGPLHGLTSHCWAALAVAAFVVDAILSGDSAMTHDIAGKQPIKKK